MTSIKVEETQRPNAAFIRAIGIDPNSIPEELSVITHDNGKAGIGVEIVQENGFVVLEDNVHPTAALPPPQAGKRVKDALVELGAHTL